MDAIDPDPAVEQPVDAVALELHIYRDVEPVAGVVEMPGSGPRAFCGWLEFVAAVDAARRATND